MCPYGLEIDISSSFFCTSGKETVESLKISPGQLAPCQEKRIKRQQTVRSAGCKVLAPNVGFLFASMPSYCRFRPIDCSFSQSVSVSVPQDKILGSAILCRGAYSLSPLLGTHCGDRILSTWHPICVRGRRSQTRIGLDRTVEAGRSTFVTRHRAYERMTQQWRKTVLLMSQFCPLRTRTTVHLKTWKLLLTAYLARSFPHTFHAEVYC